MSDQKRRAGGTLAPKTTVKASQKHWPAKTSVQDSHPVSIESLTSLSGYLLRQAQLFVFHDFNQRLAPLDLRPAQYSVLSVTRENPALSQMELSHVLGIGRSAIVPLLDVLEARGLLTRRPAADRRSHALYLTAKGNGLLARADVLVQQNQDRTIEKIGRRNHGQLLKILEVFGRPESSP